VRRLSRYVHPHVLQIIDFGEARGHCYVVMEHFHGQALSAVLEQRRFVVIRGALQVATRTLEALKYVREQGPIPPWVSPQRVLVSPKHDVKLWLFEDPETPHAGPGHVEAPYVAPEIAAGDVAPGDSRALVYSVAALLYHMLAGIPPFEGASTAEVTKRALQGRPPALRRINLKVSPALAGAVEGAIARDPADRPDSIAEFVRQLKRAAGGR